MWVVARSRLVLVVVCVVVGSLIVGCKPHIHECVPLVCLLCACCCDAALLSGFKKWVIGCRRPATSRRGPLTSFLVRQSSTTVSSWWQQHAKGCQVLTACRRIVDHTNQRQRSLCVGPVMQVSQCFRLSTLGARVAMGARSCVCLSTRV